MSGSLAPQWLFQIFDDVGNIASGAKLYAWIAGTTEPSPVYADFACTTPLANPYSANSAGRMNFWLKDGIAYRLRVEDAAGNALCDRWPIRGGNGSGTSDHLVIVDEGDLVAGTLAQKLEDSSTITWEISGNETEHKVKASFIGTIPVSEKESFPEIYINWLQDEANDLWEKPDGQLAFRVDLVTKGFTKLKWFKSIFAGNNGFPSGKFAIYGNLNAKLVEDTLPDYEIYPCVEFDPPIDISAYDFLVVVMDPGLDGFPQPISQSISFIPSVSALSRVAFAGTFQHDHNTSFPSECPAMISTDIKYMLARWCAIGVQ